MKAVIPWIFGVGAMISLFLIYQQKERKKLLRCKLSADICWVIHYLCLGAYGGAVPNFVGIFRELVFVRRGEKKWAENRLWPVFFIAANLTLGLLTFNRPINILPLTASAFVTVSLWLKNPKLTKLISVPVSLAFLIYDLVVGSWIGMVNESIAILSLIISFLRKDQNHQPET